MSRFSYLCGINPSSTSASHVVSQRAGYVSGGALQRHMASAHAGFFDDKCAACLELSAKTVAVMVTAYISMSLIQLMAIEFALSVVCCPAGRTIRLEGLRPNGPTRHGRL